LCATNKNSIVREKQFDGVKIHRNCPEKNAYVHRNMQKKHTN